MKNRTNYIAISLTILILSAVFLGILYAQNANRGLSVSPSNFEISANPGDQVVKSITLQNLTDQDFDIGVDRRNFTAKGEEGSVDLTTNDTGFALSSWISVTPTRTNIPSNGKTTFRLTVSIPKNAEPGGHFGSIVFRTIPKANLNQTGALLSQEIGALLLVKVAGEVKENAAMEEFSANKMFYEWGPVTFTARIKNDSLVHIKPEGSIVIEGMFGQKDSIAFDTRNVLPQATRKILTTWNKSLLIGKYKANILLVYGDHNQTIAATTEFWAFPVRLFLILLVVLFLLFLMRKRLGRSLKILFTGK